MERDTVWAVVDRERAGLADALDDLTPQEWERPSLCAGWRVRDVAAHLTMGPTTGPGTVLAQLVRARGSFNRMVHDTAVRKACQPVSETVGQLRSIIGSRRLVLGTTYQEPLLDILVHGQDMLLPLGRARPMPPPAARVAAQRIWTMPFPFWARRRLRGYRLTATDLPWAVGEGELVEGPIESLVLLLTGRPAGLPRLTGDGAARLAEAIGGTVA
jgi:uncharacterized protein (TIGR03083 family)